MRVCGLWALSLSTRCPQTLFPELPPWLTGLLSPTIPHPGTLPGPSTSILLLLFSSQEKAQDAVFYPPLPWGLFIQLIIKCFSLADNYARDLA